MREWARVLCVVAGLFGAAGVALAAVGAHRAGNPNVTTAAYFLLFHASPILALGSNSWFHSRASVLIAATFMASGAALFSGELAIHALSGVAVLPIAAPTGGVLMIAGWLLTAVVVPLAIGRLEEP